MTLRLFDTATRTVRDFVPLVPGEVMERFEQVHLVRGTTVETTVPTYRGEQKTFG